VKIKSKTYSHSFSKKIKSFELASKWKLIVCALMGLILIALFGLWMIYYGMVLSITGKAGSINDLVHNIAVNKLQFIPNYFRGLSSIPEKISLDIRFKNFQKIQYHRQVSLALGNVSSEGKDEDIPAKLTYKGKVYKVKLNLTGATLKHVADPERWSYRVKIMRNKTVLGMRRFSLLYPRARGYLTDWVGHMLSRKNGLIGLRYDFVDVTVNGKHIGLYLLEEHFGKHLIEHNRYRDGIVFKIERHQLRTYGKKRINLDPKLKARMLLLNTLWQAFLTDEIPAHKIFDVGKMAKIYAITDLLNGEHAVSLANMRFYFNPITNLIEPIAREWNPLRYSDLSQSDRKMALFIEKPSSISFYHRKLFGDIKFTALYLKELDRISKPEFLNSFFHAVAPEMKKILRKVYREDPFYVYPKELLYNNQSYIRSKLYPEEPTVAAYFLGKNDDNIMISLRNLQVLPVNIEHILVKGTILEPIGDDILQVKRTNPGTSYSIMNFALPESFAWSDTMSHNIEIVYYLVSSDYSQKAIVFPWDYQNANSGLYNPTKQNPNYKEFDFLKIDKANNRILFKGGNHYLDHDLIIPEDFEVIADGGLKIDFTNSAKIISYSPLLFIGTEDNPISLYSSDGTGQGIVVINAKTKSSLENVDFNGLTNPSQNGWQLSGTITFYESPVHIRNCSFSSNNSGDDLLNIVRSGFVIQNTVFFNAFSDALDLDFSDGIILNSSFINSGNDAVDFSGSVVEMKNVIIDKVGDKGLSAGESSKINAQNVEIKNAELAVVSKDLSEIVISNSDISKSKVGFVAFQKKPEFGPASIVATNIALEKNQIPYLIESESTLILDNKKIEPNRNNVKDILYGVEYGKSSK